jgi:glycosyltransferase involved in cell wall biosynthesis
MLKKVVFITEYLNPPYDEGIKKTAYNLWLELGKKYELLAICRHGFEKENLHIVNTNALYFSAEVKSLIKNFKPDALVYLPFQSSTFASYLRLKVLAAFAKKARPVFIALQPKPLKKWQQGFVKFIKPKMALTPSPTLKQFWDTIEVPNKIIPLLTDLTIFKPIGDITTKEKLRKKYSLPVEATVISHMGHLNEGRNLQTLIPLQQAGFQVVILGSSSTPTDAVGTKSIKNTLLASGIIIIDRFIKHIEEMYQLSDIYIFPVVKKNSSIGMPLSILEARACGIPVITTNYGSIQTYMQDDFGGIKYSEPNEFLSAVTEINTKPTQTFIKTKVSELNNSFYDTLYTQIDS